MLLFDGQDPFQHSLGRGILLDEMENHLTIAVDGMVWRDMSQLSSLWCLLFRSGQYTDDIAKSCVKT